MQDRLSQGPLASLDEERCQSAACRLVADNPIHRHEMWGGLFGLKLTGRYKLALQ